MTAPQIKFLPETILPTIVVKSRKQLDTLIESFQTLRIVWIHFNFRSTPGRLGKCVHILLNIKSSIVVINLEAFKHDGNIWDRLQKDLFENTKLEKVFFAPECAVDYLWHQHSIRMANFTSLLVLHGCIGRKQFPMLENLQIEDKHMKLKQTLVSFLDYYLPNEICPFEYAIMLKDYSERPRRNAERYKYLKKQFALQVKYLPQLHNAMMRMAMRGIDEYIDKELALTLKEA